MLNIKSFFELLKKQQKPYENNLSAAMQAKVDWIKKCNTYPNLTDRQKHTLEQDMALIGAVDDYIIIQQQIISRLSNELEQMNTLSASHFSDKLDAERALMDYIVKDKSNGQIQSAA